MSSAYLLVFAFGAIGLADTFYLIYHWATKTDVACPFFPKRWCVKVQHSKQSKTFGIPNPIAGFIMYTLIVVFLYSFLVGTMSLTPLMIVVGIGFLFSLYFMFVQIFKLHALCTWCVLSFVNFTVMAYALFLM